MGWICVAEGAVDAARRLARDESGQGTTEYAILVGVLVVAVMRLRL